MQVGSGLAKAHAAGIVHRDIKPANLMVTADATVKILDFGLAKLAGSEGVTQTGTTVGTVAYMSPEQARGQEVDHRTDIWSLGVVLYEMLAGAPPFQGENLLSISNAILDHEQPPLTGSSSAAQSVVTRSLAKDRTQRYQAIADLLGELRALQSSSDAPTVVTPAQQDVPSIAVLPFTDMSPAKDQEYFCDGLAEELIDALARLEGLRVVGRTSSFQFRGKGHDLRKIGQELEVATVLEGSVRKAGSRLRINAQLINTRDGYHLWSERYDREMEDVFEVQDEIARTVVDKLKVKLLRTTPTVGRPTDNLEAYNLCLEGRFYFMRATGPAFEKSLECFTRALALDPTYARAHAGVAQVRTYRAVMSLAAPRTVMSGAKEAALKAIALDETLPEAHHALANVHHFYEWNWLEAEREYRRALELNPGDSHPRGNYALLLAEMGRVAESVAEARSAIERDPIASLPRHYLTHVFLHAKRYDEARAAAKAGIELDPNYYLHHVNLGLSLVCLAARGESPYS